MKNLSDDEIIRVIREEWKRKLKKLSETIDLSISTKVGGKEKDVISQGLKVKRKEKSEKSGKKSRGDLRSNSGKPGQEYTVEEIGPVSIALSYVEDGDDEKKIVYISREDLENYYDLA